LAVLDSMSHAGCECHHPYVTVVVEPCSTT
jgi:hypothetical protein